MPPLFREFFAGSSGPGAEAVLALALRRAAARAGLSPARRDEWEISVTHKEARASLVYY